MAPSGSDPPDATLTKHYKCHPNVKVGAVVCIVCGNFFHTTELVAKYNNGCPIKFIDSTFVICQDHPNLALTSSLPYGALTQEATKFIAQFKLVSSEQIKQDIINEIVHEKQNDENGKAMETTIYENYDELQALKIENNLLKELYKETKEKNDLLNELLIKERQNRNTNVIRNNTYAEIIATPKPKNKRVPRLIVKKTNSSDNTNLENTVAHYLVKDKNIQTKKMQSKNNDTIIINCMNEESVNALEKTLTRKLPNIIKIEKEQIRKPIVRVIGIHKSFTTNEKDIESDINQRNFSNIEDKCKILHTFTNERTKTISAIVEVSSTIYKHIKNNKSRLFVGYQNCRVFDVINTTPCSKCARFSHGGNKCRNDATCIKCTGNHTADMCNSNTLKCPNCTYHNNKFSTKYNTDHCANDSQLCEVLKNKIKKYIEMTDYPLQPTYQRYFGKVEHTKVQRTVTDIRTIMSSNASLATLSTPSPPTRNKLNR